MLEHTREQVGAPSRELVLIEHHFHAVTAREAQAVVSSDPRIARLGAHVQDALDLLRAGERITEVVEPQQLLQRLRAAFNEGEIVEGELGNQTPQLGLPKQGRDDGRWFQQRDDALDGPAAREREVAALVAERQPAWQITVEAREAARRRFERRAGGSPGEIREGEIEVRVTRLTVLARPGSGIPERLRLVAVGAVAERVQRFEPQHFRRPGPRGHNVVDRKDPSAFAPAGIRDDGMLVARRDYLHRFRSLGEQVDDWCTAEQERALGYPRLEDGSPLGPLEARD